MRVLFPYIASACLTGFSATSGSAVIAGGCSSYMNKLSEIECSEDDNDCQTEKAEKFNFKDTIKS